ncbi:hypothetical protein GCM10010251_67500 [Streptomyces aurantiogriseus]|uniref:Uncharacterized protein n=1 Tax=Streptomyces aurantiogriseus TaxID=66870 RepID=A0A918FIU2_9ACTN|nr:hypothetical protein GCM10010251_67500 [Streptomyces aurantiogriseus]
MAFLTDASRELACCRRQIRDDTAQRGLGQSLTDAVEGGQRQQERRLLVGQEEERDADLGEAGAQAGEAQHGVASVAIGDTAAEKECRDHRDQGRSGNRGQPGRAIRDLQDAKGQGDRRHGTARHGDRLATQKPPEGSGAERPPGREARRGCR